VGALILVNFQQEKKQNTHLYLLSTCFLSHKLNAQRAILLPNHGGINIAPDVPEITPKNTLALTTS